MKQRSLVATLALALVALTGCGGTGTSAVGTTEAASSGGAPAAASSAAEAATSEQPDGVYKFGETVKFEDGSTLTVYPAEAFKRDEFAFGGEKFPATVKFKCVFTNNGTEKFDPALTSGSVTSGGVEGESVFQEGLDAPENAVLPGKSVTWYMGYGVNDPKDLQLDVSIGFLDYEEITFVS